MTTLAQTRAHGHAGLSLEGRRRAVADWRAESRKRAAYRETRRQLLQLTDRELDDLGVARWDVDVVAHRAVYGR